MNHCDFTITANNLLALHESANLARHAKIPVCGILQEHSCNLRKRWLGTPLLRVRGLCGPESMGLVNGRTSNRCFHYRL